MNESSPILTPVAAAEAAAWNLDKPPYGKLILGAFEHRDKFTRGEHKLKVFAVMRTHTDKDGDHYFHSFNQGLGEEQTSDEVKSYELVAWQKWPSFPSTEQLKYLRLHRSPTL